MKNDKHLFLLSWKAFVTFLGTIGKPQASFELLRAFAFAVAAILLAASEPFKILLRRYFGSKVLSKANLIFMAVVYLGWAFYIMAESRDLGNNEWQQASIPAAFFFYVILSIGILLIGYSEYNKTDEAKVIDVNYRGESLLFGALVKRDNMDERKIWAISEPFICIVLSLIITALSLAIGLPLLITAISFFLGEYFWIYWEPSLDKSRKATMEIVHDQRKEQQKDDDRFSPVS